MADYNYTGFSSTTYNLDKFDGPGPGDKAPDFEVGDIDGVTQNILTFDGSFLVLEIGSITCPLFQSRRGGMATMLTDFPQIDQAILYVREAHPGAQTPAHENVGQKIDQARKLRERDGEGRKILIDGIEGRAHRAYGGYPNAVFIINPNGCVVYRSAWNNPDATRRAVVRLLAGKPVRSESLFFPARPPVVLRTLKHAGKGAALDFFSSLPTLIWKNVIKRNLMLLLGRENRIKPDAAC